MKTVAIITRRLKEGKTYEDFRKAWYHTVGFGTPTKMYTAISVDDPRDIIVMGFVESELENYMDGLKIDVKERLENPLDSVIEPEVGRQFGILVSEDDFSSEGSLEYQSPSINGKETNLEEVYRDLSEIAEMISSASAERDEKRGK
jgi:hypothetical protein